MMDGVPLRVFAVDWNRNLKATQLEGLTFTNSIDLKIVYPRKSGILDITEVVQLAVRDSGVQRGIAHVQLLQNSAALFVGSPSGAVHSQYLDFFSKLVDGVGPVADLCDLILGTSISLQFDNSSIALGEEQRILIGEFDGGQERVVRILLLGV